MPPTLFFKFFNALLAACERRLSCYQATGDNVFLAIFFFSHNVCACCAKRRQHFVEYPILKLASCRLARLKDATVEVGFGDEVHLLSMIIRIQYSYRRDIS